MKNNNPIKKILILLLIISSAIPLTSFPIDNPDRKDIILEFNQRAKNFEDATNKEGLSNRELISAYNDYGIFLDTELNKIYKVLNKKLSKIQSAELEKSQKIWIKFRDAEIEFISNNWSRNNFGSSAFLSRGQYRSRIIKNRVIDLLLYLKNY